MASITKNKETPKTKDLEIAISKYCLIELKHEIVVPRCSAVGFEADILSINKTAFLHEFELKISRQDFLKDKSKTKWQFYESNSKYSPNYFWYVCPKDMIDANEIKDYQGLIYYEKSGVYEIKKPKRISSKKCNKRIYRSMIRSLSYKLLNESIKLDSIQKGFE